jgi:hypothetical protein
MSPPTPSGTSCARTALDADTALLVVGRLVSLAINESETKVRESALNSISEVFNHHRLPLDLVEPWATAMPTMEHELLEHALYILGATHDPQARSVIEPFLLHPTQSARRSPARGSRAGGSHP